MKGSRQIQLPLILLIAFVTMTAVETNQAVAQKTTTKEKAKISVAQHIKNIQEFVRKQEAAAKKKEWNYTSVSEEEITRKLGRIDSPMIVFQSWSGSTSPGGSISYTVGLYNPDPVRRSSIYAHVFVGPANMVRDVGTALTSVDARFPRLTMPDFFGLSIPSGGNDSLSFTVDVPCCVQKTNYLGNTFLFGASYHDVGTYFDRSVFPFEVK